MLEKLIMFLHHLLFMAKVLSKNCVHWWWASSQLVISIHWLEILVERFPCFYDYLQSWKKCTLSLYVFKAMIKNIKIIK